VTFPPFSLTNLPAGVRDRLRREHTRLTPMTRRSWRTAWTARLVPRCSCGWAGRASPRTAPAARFVPHEIAFRDWVAHVREVVAGYDRERAVRFTEARAAAPPPALRGRKRNQ